MKYAACCVPVSAIRKDPSHQSELVSQLLFGECCTVLEFNSDRWVKIKCRYDNYEGWSLLSHIAEIGEDIFLAPDKELTDDWVSEVDYKNNKMFIPLGSSLTMLRKNSGDYFSNVWKPGEVSLNTNTIEQVAFKFLNTAYLWGGKTVFGIDCSGFTQSVYKFLNIQLPRDAWQQAGEGDTVDSLAEAVCGDLGFFDNEDGKVTHVGMILNPKEIIHSSGKVRIDKIDNEGIENSETKERTHKLRVIKRYFKIID